MNDIEEFLSLQRLHAPAQVVAQVLVAIFDATRSVRAPNLLRDGLSKHAQLPLAFPYLQIRSLQLGCSLQYFGLKLIPGNPNCVLGSLPDRKSTRLNSSHTDIYTLSLHDALPICFPVSPDSIAAARLFAPVLWPQADPGQSELRSRLASRSEEHTSELQSHRYLHSFPTRRSSDLLSRISRFDRCSSAVRSSTLASS